MTEVVTLRTGGARAINAAVVTFCLMAALLTLPVDSANAGSERKVQGIANSIVAIIKGGGSTAQKTAKFRSAFIRHADVRTMGNFALGRYARTVKGPKRKRYFSLIDDYVTRKFAALIVTSPVSAVKVSKSTKRGSDELVSSRVEFSDGRPSAPMTWRLRRGKIIDISFQGAWIVNTQKDVFTSIISRNNGNIDALLKHMGG